MIHYCGRRAIRCALLDAFGRIVSTGHNGPAFGPCNCPGKDVPAGAGSATLCYGMHGEQRAIVAAGLDISEALTFVGDKAPCLACTKLLLGTPVNRVLFGKPSNETENRELWENAGREWIHDPELVKQVLYG